MSGHQSFKFSCPHCGGHIEATAAYGGHSIACPHCGRSIVVPAAETSPPESGGARADPQLFVKRLGRALMAASIGAGLLLAGVAFWASRRAPANQVAAGSAAGRAGQPATGSPEKPVGSPGATARPKPGEGLRAGEVSIEKQPKSSLMYAVGTVTNLSGQQRFGVRIELEILDKENVKLGEASDYTQVLEPGATWAYRALLPDSHAAGVRVARIREEP